MCVFVKDDFCTDVTVVERHCCTDLEFLVLKCRPFHLSHEHSALFVFAVFIHARANAKSAMRRLHEAISRQQDTLPDSFIIVDGDINPTNLKSVLPQ